MKKIQRKEQSGRSMVEMLGVLAIIGVLSVGGVAGYRYAMDQIAYNKMLDIFSKFELMYFTETNNWENSIFNVPDSELCGNYPSSQQGECHDFENEYFCNNYAGKQYCSNQVVTGGLDWTWYGRYAFSGKTIDNAWTWAIGFFYDSFINSKVLFLNLRFPQPYCKEFLMHVYKSALRPHLAWVGSWGGTREFPYISEIQAINIINETCEQPRNLVHGSLFGLKISVNP